MAIAKQSMYQTIDQPIEYADDISLGLSYNSMKSNVTEDLRGECRPELQQSRGCSCKWFTSLQKLVKQAGEHNRISLIGLEFEESRRY